MLATLRALALTPQYGPRARNALLDLLISGRCSSELAAQRQQHRLTQADAQMRPEVTFNNLPFSMVRESSQASVPSACGSVDIARCRRPASSPASEASERQWSLVCSKYKH